MSAEKHPNSDVAKMSYEEARDQLIQLVAELEQGNVSLEVSLALWERGEALANQCESWLSGARKRLDAAIEAKKNKA